MSLGEFDGDRDRSVLTLPHPDRDCRHICRGVRWLGSFRGRDKLCGASQVHVRVWSRSTSLLTMANRKLADNPHIRTPMMLSTGPKVRHI